MGKLSKILKTNKKKGKFNLPFFKRFLAFLTMFLLGFLKKKTSLCRQFFERNLNLLSELQKYEFENLASHRGKDFWMSWGDP